MKCLCKKNYSDYNFKKDNYYNIKYDCDNCYWVQYKTSNKTNLQIIYI